MDDLAPLYTINHANMTKTTTTKTVRIGKETKIFLKNVDLKINGALKSIQKEWKNDQPERDKYKKAMKTNTNLLKTAYR